MAVFRLIFGLGFTGGGASWQSFTLTDGDILLGDAADVDRGSFDGPAGATYVIDNIDVFPKLTSIVLSDNEITDGSVEDDIVCAITVPNAVNPVVTITDDPDNKFKMVGLNLVLSASVDIGVSTTHDLDLHVEADGGQSFTQSETITVESAAAAISFNRTDGVIYGSFVSGTTELAGADIGTPSATRKVFVFLGKGSGSPSTVPTCTIDGVNAPRVYGSDTSGRGCHVFALAVAAGTDADIIVTHASSNTRCFEVYETHNLTSLTPVGTPVDAGIGAGLYDLSINTPVGEALVIPLTVNRDGDETATWVGATETSLLSNGHVGLSCALFISSSAETPHAMSVDWSNSPSGNAISLVLQ